MIKEKKKRSILYWKSTYEGNTCACSLDVGFYRHNATQRKRQSVFGHTAHNANDAWASQRAFSKRRLSTILYEYIWKPNIYWHGIDEGPTDWRERSRASLSIFGAGWAYALCVCRRRKWHLCLSPMRSTSECALHAVECHEVMWE